MPRVERISRAEHDPRQLHPLGAAEPLRSAPVEQFMKGAIDVAAAATGEPQSQCEVAEHELRSRWAERPGRERREVERHLVA